MENQPLPPPVPIGFPDVPAAAPAAPLRKKPWLAFLLGAFPGIGHVYDGLYVRGLVFFAICATLLALTINVQELFSFVMAFFWIFNMLDAYRQAVLINYGYTRDLGLTDLPARPTLAQGGLVAGVGLFLIGTAAALNRFFNVDLTFLLDLWPVGLMLIGAWMVVAAVRQKRREREGLSEGPLQP